MSDRDGFAIPEVGGALRHLAGRVGAAPIGTGAGDTVAAHADVSARLTAGVHRSARSALADRLAALAAEAASRCRPSVELRPDDVGPEHRRLPSDLLAEARRLASRMQRPLPEDVLAPLPDDPQGCRARIERLLDALEQLEGQSVRVTDARLRLTRAGR